MIPADEDDAEFVKWLKALNVPKGSNAPGPEPTHRATAAEYLHRLKISSAPKPPPEEEPPRKVSRLAAIREKVLPAFFGPEYTVHPDESGEKPAIEILVFEPGTSEQGTERDYTTLVTSGLSDARMPVPEGSPYHRAELLMYVEEPDLTHANVMQWLARLPHQQKTTWYSPGTTMSNGNPPQPIFEDSELDCFLFLSSIVGNDDKVHEELVLDGDPVLMLWVVLITHAERQFIIERGLDDFMNVLDENKHSFVLDEGRKSFVEPDE
jgi:hypothetical protein